MGCRIRIALSLLFGAIAFALCVLWVSSYWRQSALHLLTTHGNQYELVSEDGMLVYLKYARIFFGFEFIREDPYWCVHKLTAESRLGFGRCDDAGDSAVGVAYGWLVLLTGTASGLPWFRGRFSLRMLMLATAMVAVLLGAICYCYVAR